MVIYKTTNNVNGKIYIGKRILSKEKFLSRDYFGSGKIILRAINKYGISNFSREIIEECTDKKELSEREKYWIIFYKSKVPNGYNIGDGGEGDNGGQNKNRKWTQATKDKISNAIKYLFKIGHLKAPFKGKHLLEETKDKIRLKRMKQVFSKNSLLKISKTLKKKWANKKSTLYDLKMFRIRGKKTSIGLKKYYSNTLNKPGNYVEREIRICACGCNQTFKCKNNSKRKYIFSWHTTKRWK